MKKVLNKLEEAISAVSETELPEEDKEHLIGKIDNVKYDILKNYVPQPDDERENAEGYQERIEAHEALNHEPEPVAGLDQF
jgi:hypothetical protein